jgi:hypothetical protein
MTYSLRVLVLESTSELLIDKSTYDLCENSVGILRKALAIEENYELLILSYSDFEKAIFEVCSNAIIRNDRDYINSFDRLTFLNIKLVNLLTTARMYVDQVIQHAQGCNLSANDAKKATKEYFKIEYDKNQGYRFMEALRNHVQHCGSPIHKVTSNGVKVYPDGDYVIEYSMTLKAIKTKLQKDSTFKKSVIREIGDEVDLVKSTRQYIESIGVIQNKIRELINQ